MKVEIIYIFLFMGFSMTVFSQQNSVNISSLGAISDGVTDNTKIIQNAIDRVTVNGGQVIIPKGFYMTSPFVLKSDVELHFNEGAVLLASTDRIQYHSKPYLALISCSKGKNISITGNGLIDGKGRDLIVNLYGLLNSGKIKDEQWRIKRPEERNRPMILAFNDCENIKINGITLKDAACWVQVYKQCNKVDISNLKVESVCYWNNDGIDIVDCKNVVVANSSFNVADDGICLKSEAKDKICENIFVNNCIVRSSASGFKLGTGSKGGFKNIVVNGLTVYDTYRSAIALESVDGAVLEDINIKNVAAMHVGNAIFLRLGHRNTDEHYGELKNVHIENVKAEITNSKPDAGYPVEGPLPKVAPHNLLPSSIMGLPMHPVQNVVLENIEIVYGGGGNRQQAYVSVDSLDQVTENVAGYPEFSMFGELPAWGFYVRHAEGVIFKNIKLKYTTEDYRPSIIAVDVNKIELNNVTILTAKGIPVIVLQNVLNSSIHQVNLPVDNTKGILMKP